MSDQEESHPAIEPHHHPPSKMTEVDEKQHHNKDDGVSGRGYIYRYYGGERGRHNISMVLVILLVLAGIIALTVWLVYRPNDPKFRVISASVYELNATSAPFVSSTMQFTIVTRNPNSRVSLVYDEFSAFVTYRNQAITPPAILPPLHHSTKTTLAFSPVIGGSAPVGQDIVNGLIMDSEYGVVALKVVLMGKVRYHGGPLGRGHHSIYVKCYVYVEMKKGQVGELPILGSPPCSVDL